MLLSLAQGYVQSAGRESSFAAIQGHFGAQSLRGAGRWPERPLQDGPACGISCLALTAQAAPAIFTACPALLARSASSCWGGQFEIFNKLKCIGFFKPDAHCADAHARWRCPRSRVSKRFAETGHRWLMPHFCGTARLVYFAFGVGYIRLSDDVSAQVGAATIWSRPFALA